LVAEKQELVGLAELQQRGENDRRGAEVRANVHVFLIDTFVLKVLLSKEAT